MTNRQNKCFISLAIKALGIKKKFELYTSEKEYAKAGKFSDVNNQNSLGNKFSESLKKISLAPRRKPNFFKKLSAEDSVENFMLKSILGFIGGVFLTYICFMFLVFSLNFTLKRATYICMGLGVILSLGLAFSVKIRCTVFLCIPQLFSKRGRQALLAYAFILALSGPAKNTLHNVEVMSESLACTQEQLKQAENELLKCIQKPNAAAKKSIEKLLEKINSAVKHFKNFILQLYKNCFAILETVLQAQKWLYSITFLCQKKMGQPAHSCLNLLDEATENCESALPLNSWRALCQISTQCKKMICYTNAKSVCPNTGFEGCLPVLKLKKQLEAFKHRAMNILYVKLEAQQTYCQANRSHTYHEEYQGMATEIRQKTDQFLQYFDVMSVIFGIFILVLFVKVVIYRHKFLTEDHYDNRYITADFIDIDNARAEFHMDTILPLEPREKMQYIKVTSVRLVPCERVRLLSSFVFLIFATFKIIIHMLTDLSLYWILSSVRREERVLYMNSFTDELSFIAFRIEGYGLVASLLKNVSRTIGSESSFTRMDPTPCLPDPVPPDWNRYFQILALVIICWLLALWEPYGLRLRHAVMVTYHPDRARERAMWLYNKIISNRNDFVKTSRRKLRKKYKGVAWKDTFRYKLMGLSTPKCLLCGISFECAEAQSRNGRIKCSAPNCPGIYCEPCYAILKFCNICHDPAEYGDSSDVSEEKDSSEDEDEDEDEVQTKGKRGRKRAWRKVTKDDDEEEEERKDSEKDTSLVTLLSCKSSKDEMPIYETLKPAPSREMSDWEYESFMSEGSDPYERTNELSDVCSAGKLRGRGKGIQSNRDESSGQKLSCLSRDDVKRDFNFKNSKKDFLASVAYSKARDSIEILKHRLSRKREGSSSPNGKKYDAGVPARDRKSRKDLKEEDKTLSAYEWGSLPSIPKMPVTTGKSSEIRTSERLPFIDPINVHEFLPDSDSEDREKDHFEREITRRRKKKGKKGKVFVYEKKRDASNAKLREDPDVKIFFREEKDLSENDGQFYCESYCSESSQTRLLTPTGRRSPVGRPVVRDKHRNLYSLETDSSFENFLSVKVPRRRTEHRKSGRRTRRRRHSGPRPGDNYFEDTSHERSGTSSGEHYVDSAEFGAFHARRDLGRSSLRNVYSGSTFSEDELNILVLGRIESRSRSDCN